MDVRIRRMTENDLEPLHGLLSDPEVMRYLEPPFTRAQTEQFLKEAGLAPVPLVYAAEADGAFAGYVIFHDYDETAVELGWVLKPAYWGRGIASRLTEQLIAGAEASGKQAVIECVPEQKATIHIARKFGFADAGTRDGLAVFRRDWAAYPDRTIPFYNTILRCGSYPVYPVVLPDGYAIRPYRRGDEKAWARLECAIGDFETEAEAEAYFLAAYGAGDARDILFAQDEAGRTAGSCIAWTDSRKGGPVCSLHWLAVDAAHQRRGIGRALCAAVMNRFSERGGGPVYIHTQPWSWKAVLLYVSMGFRLQKTDSFAAYENQYENAAATLARVLTAEDMRYLAEHTDA